MTSKELMTATEVADYLRIKQRKVYELVAEQSIPCSRIGDKWVFPKALIDLWILENLQWRGGEVRPPRPKLLTGSHDPLLDWAIRQSRCGLATAYTGSVDGLHAYAHGEAMVCGLHVLDASSGDYNVPLIMRSIPGDDSIIVQWVWREQGLIVAPDNPQAIMGLADLFKPGVRVIKRQIGAGSGLLLETLLTGKDLDAEQLQTIEPPAHSETEVAEAIATDRADAGLGIRAAANTHGLEFVPLHRERFDLLMSRRDYFEEPVQTLLRYCAGPDFAERAAKLGGYEISDLGCVVFNGA